MPASRTPDSGTAEALGGICSLPPADLAGRLAWIRSEILPHTLSREPIADGAAWTLRDAPGLADRLDALVALESACCPTLAIAHRETAPGARRLEITGLPPGLQARLGDEDAEGSPGSGRRAGLALALGAAAALLVCCVLPLAAAALLGAAVAAPLATLDQPWTIAATAAGFAAATYAWQTRRRSAASAPRSD